SLLNKGKGMMVPPRTILRPNTSTDPIEPSLAGRARCFRTRAIAAPATGVLKIHVLEFLPVGAVAQLGERRVRNAKVGSSILLRSTKYAKVSRFRLAFFVGGARGMAGIRAFYLASCRWADSPFWLYPVSAYLFSVCAPDFTKVLAACI